MGLALEVMEENAVVHRPSPTTHADALLRALHFAGRKTAVVTDNARSAVVEYLTRHDRADAVQGRIFARPADLSLLMPNPARLREALDRLGASPATGVFIASSITELTAATTLGLPFVGHARNRRIARQLRRAGCEHTVASLKPLYQAPLPT